MRLKNIKLAGFKSFVDPTTVPFPGNLTSIVGPNGCGKSNIIDAVRWVMGESSAKQLRGESLDDVIFNGSTTRKPAGQAAIELLFDNSAGTLTGQYTSYAEIVIRREITRDGQSHYYLNGTRCRRRDIIDLFLGTGVGSRSYAIIEQGMVSRLVEAKPDDLRIFLEEAAGISKYKERRRETELRIEHTRENLARLYDVREELTKQLNHLQRQAAAAEQYNNLKQQEHTLKAQIYALRYRYLQNQLAQHASELEAQEQQLALATTAHHHCEAEISQERELYTQMNEQAREVQARYYHSENEKNRLEQTIAHQQERRMQWEHELKEIAHSEQLKQQQFTVTQQQAEKLQTDIAAIEPQCSALRTQADTAQQILQQAEQAQQQWQQRWEEFTQARAQINQQIQVEQTKIQHLTQTGQSLQERINILEAEYTRKQRELEQEPIADYDQRLNDLQHRYQTTDADLQQLIGYARQQQEKNQQLTQQLDEAKSQLQTLLGQQASLQALQQAALGEREQQTQDWLQRHGLKQTARLAQLLHVESGWEAAVETVLTHFLQAICLTDQKTLLQLTDHLPDTGLSLVAKDVVSSRTSSQQHALLLEKVQGPKVLTHLLAGIYAADTLQQAQTWLDKLAPHESVITRSGVWLGSGWLQLVDKNAAQAGILQRERDLTDTKKLIEKATTNVRELETTLQTNLQHLRENEQRRETLQQQLAEVVAVQAEVRANQQVSQARQNQFRQRMDQLACELQECKTQLASDQTALQAAQQNLQQARQMNVQQVAQQQQLIQQKDQQQVSLEHVRQQAQEKQKTAYELALREQAFRLQLSSALQEQKSINQQLHELKERAQRLQQAIAENLTPNQRFAEQLAQLVQQQASLMHELQAKQEQVEAVAQTLRDLEQQRQQQEVKLSELRQQLEQIRLQRQSLQVRASGLQEQLSEMGCQLTEILQQLSAEAAEDRWEEKLLQISRKIERLGAINLAAIEECQQILERKQYLDEQCSDVEQALVTLEDAIKKMDKETRTRFKETYEKANHNFQTLFPQLFGGGRASLDLIGEDWLSSGLVIMAQPPGKKNSTIHLLSGGEKALTAIALVFALFQLNPAPFCMLDEVDAPLDDTNVIRFCNLVKTMSKQIQFIFISHNKLAIEMAHHLIGITMQEPGVSRLVAVDVEEAIALAAV